MIRFATKPQNPIDLIVIINLMKYSKLILIVALLGFVQLQQVNGVVERGKNYAIPPAPPMLANLSDPERR